MSVCARVGRRVSRWPMAGVSRFVENRDTCRVCARRAPAGVCVSVSCVRVRVDPITRQRLLIDSLGIGLALPMVSAIHLRSRTLRE